MQRTFLALFIVATASMEVGAQEFPLNGSGQSDHQSSSVYFRCKPPRAGRLLCTFNQVLVRKSVKVEDLPTALRKAPDLAKDFLDAKACTNLETLASAVQTGKVPPGVDGEEYQARLTKMLPEQRTEFRSILDGMTELCLQPSLPAAENLIRLTHSKGTRTCNISSASFEQTFTWNAESNRWESTTARQGPCGIIDFSTLEQDENYKSLWNYRTGKFVTKTGSQALPGSTCGDVGDVEYFYSWRAEDIYLKCDYIKFGQF